MTEVRDVAVQSCASALLEAKLSSAARESKGMDNLNVAIHV